MRTVRAPLTDGPRGGFQPAVRHVLRVFLRAFRSIHFVGGFLLHGVRGRLECQTVHDGADGPRAHRGRSIIEGTVLEVQVFFRTVRRNHADSPPRPCGQSARCPRTVRHVSADSPPSVRGQSAQVSRMILQVLADSPPGPVLGC
jgi:hypothetical protein